MTSEHGNQPIQFAEEAFCTVKQVAAHLGLSLSSVYELVSQGKLRAFRLGPRRGAIRIRQEDLHSYLRFAFVDAATTPPAATTDKSSGRLFKHLDAERLRAAWRKQGAIVDQQDAHSTPSSELLYDPSTPTTS